MGSFANSIHVRSGDAAAILAAIDSALSARGYRPTSAPQEPGRPMRPGLRGIYVAEPLAGWVGVMDSDMGGLLDLAQRLSAALPTSALAVLVNDSDSWHYQLFDGGDLQDEFDSVDADEESDVDASDLEKPGQPSKPLTAEDIAAMRQAVAEQMQAELAGKMPPDIRDIYQRIKQGQATAEDSQQYVQWMQRNIWRRPTVGSVLRSLFSLLVAGRKSRRKRAAQHLAHLRPLLKEGVPDKAVRRALSRQSTFAEQDLEAFLPLLGIPGQWAHLAHDYMKQTSAPDLAEAGIRVQAYRLYVR